MRAGDIAAAAQFLFTVQSYYQTMDLRCARTSDCMWYSTPS